MLILCLLFLFACLKIETKRASVVEVGYHKSKAVIDLEYTVGSFFYPYACNDVVGWKQAFRLTAGGGRV